MLVYKTIKDTEKIWCSLPILDKIDTNSRKDEIDNNFSEKELSKGKKLIHYILKRK